MMDNGRLVIKTGHKVIGKMVEISFWHRKRIAVVTRLHVIKIDFAHIHSLYTFDDCIFK